MVLFIFMVQRRCAVEVAQHVPRGLACGLVAGVGLQVFAQPQQQPQAGGIDPRQAERLLNSAAREERDVQGRKQRQSRSERPPLGKDW